MIQSSQEGHLSQEDEKLEFYNDTSEYFMFSMSTSEIFIHLIQSTQMGLIVVCTGIYRLVISIDLSETAHFAHWKSETMSEAKLFSDNVLSF